MIRIKHQLLPMGAMIQSPDTSEEAGELLRHLYKNSGKGGSTKGYSIGTIINVDFIGEGAKSLIHMIGESFALNGTPVIITPHSADRDAIHIAV